MFSFEEDSRVPFKLDQIHDYFWIKKRHSDQPCRNKLHIYPEVEVHVAKQSPAELIELGFVVLETSLLLLRMLDTQNYKKDMRFWVKRISHNADALPELLWEEGEQSNQLMLRKQNKEHLELLRFKISEPFKRCSVLRKIIVHRSKWIKYMSTSVSGIG